MHSFNYSFDFMLKSIFSKVLSVSKHREKFGRDNKKCSFSEDFFGSRKTFRSECNGAKGARGVESEARNRGGRGPSGVAVTVPSGRRSAPK